LYRSPFGALALLGTSLTLGPGPSAAEPPAPRAWPPVTPTPSEIRVDGVLDEAGWNTAVVIPLEYEWFPGDGIAPPVRTDALITYDPTHLYVAFRAHDPEPQRIRAHLMDRDTIDTFVQDDHVSLMIDTFNDERRAFQFRVNPLGVQADAIFSEVEGIEDFSWDIIWESAGRITAEGYVVEIAIPLNQIRFPAGGGPQTWGFELGRSYPRSVRHRIAATYRDRNRNCLLCQLDKLQGFENLEAGLNLELDPTLTIRRADEIESFPDGGLDDGNEDYAPGLTARWSISPSLTLNGAINPDFSQVEADVAQLDVNNRFALFFPEKRPFFLEGIDIFATPIDAVFTRTVQDPDWGVKLTGKQGKNAFGVFVARDDEPPAVILPSNQFSRVGLLDDEVSSGVLRYRRDVFQNSTIGVLFTDRESGDYSNRVGGVDGFFRLNDKNTLRFQALISDTEDPDDVDPSDGLSDFLTPAGSFDDHAVKIDWDYGSREWNASVEYDRRGEDFRADYGFVPRVDVETARVFALRTFWGEEDDWYSQIQVGVFGFRTDDLDGDVTDQHIDVFANFRGPLQSFLEISAQRNEERFRVLTPPPNPTPVFDELFDDLDRFQLFGQFQPSGAVKLSLFVDDGEVVDLANGQEGDQLLIAPTAELKLGRHLNAKLDYTRQTLDVPGGELFEATIGELRAVWQFNVRMFFRAIFQWRQTDRDLGLYGFCAVPASCPFAPQEESLFTQLLFSYKLNPQTVAFVGYTDNRADFFRDPNVGLLQSSDLEQTGRFFFVKLGYAWIF
jgi:hypothetical protein